MVANPSGNECKLVAAVLRGDERAFDTLFDCHFPRLYRFALRRLSGDREMAKDVAQTTLIKAMQSLAGFRGDAALFSWLCRICCNEIEGVRRSPANRFERVHCLDSDAASSPDVALLSAPSREQPEVQYARAQERWRLREVLDRLPGRFGDVLEWKYVEGYNVEEIARMLDSTVVAVQSLLARARSALREALQAEVGRCADDASATRVKSDGC